MRLSGPAIGLFGGSFDPAHEGHLHVARAGLRELGLDQVWWMVSPQNPLKPTQSDPQSRARSIEALGLPYGMTISHIESELGTRYTVDLLEALTSRYPRTRFVFMMGSDNLLQMPKWKAWRTIFSLVPVAVIARPGESLKARLGPVAHEMSKHRIPEWQAHQLKHCNPPAWTYLTLPLNPLSSTALRAAKAAER